MPDRRPPTSDRGFTLVETLIVMAIQGIIVTAIATAFVVFIRTEPGTEVRIDDARSTRGLATWMSHDTTSAPRFSPPQTTGGIDTDPTANMCGAATGSSIVQLSWVQQGFHNDRFWANYRYETADGEARIVRITCRKRGTGAITGVARNNVTSGLDPAHPPAVRFDRVGPDNTDPNAEVEALIMVITAKGGQTVEVVSSSRNPTDSF